MKSVFTILVLGFLLAPARAQPSLPGQAVPNASPGFSLPAASSVPTNSANISTATAVFFPGTSTSTLPPSITSANAATRSMPPDFYMSVSRLSIGRIELNVENLQAQANLAAEVASLVTINAGIQASVTNVNFTVADVSAEFEIAVHLDSLVKIVNRTLSSLDQNARLLNFNATD